MFFFLCGSFFLSVYYVCTVTGLKELVHHTLLYICTTKPTKISSKPGHRTSDSCNEIIFVQNKPGSGQKFGLPVGGTSSIQGFRMEVHYANPNQASVVDDGTHYQLEYAVDDGTFTQLGVLTAGTVSMYIRPGIPRGDNRSTFWVSKKQYIKVLK